MTETPEGTRLFLVAPPKIDVEQFAPRLAAALEAGSIAAVLLAIESDAARLVPIIQASGAAALISEDTRLAGHVKADGVQIGSGIEDLRLAVESFRPKRIVGAGNLTSRHAAMEAGETGVDYLFFGRPDGDTHDAPHPKSLELAEWWSDLMEIPAVVMGGRSLTTVAEAAASGAPFVALHEAVWSDAGGPAEAVRMAEATLARTGRRAA